MLKVFRQPNDERVYIRDRYHIINPNHPSDPLFAFCFKTSAHGEIVDRMDADKAKSLCSECVAGAYRAGALRVTETLVSMVRGD